MLIKKCLLLPDQVELKHDKENGRNPEGDRVARGRYLGLLVLLGFFHLLVSVVFVYVPGEAEQRKGDVGHDDKQKSHRT